MSIRILHRRHGLSMIELMIGMGAATLVSALTYNVWRYPYEMRQQAKLEEARRSLTGALNAVSNDLEESDWEGFDAAQLPPGGSILDGGWFRKVNLGGESPFIHVRYAFVADGSTCELVRLENPAAPEESGAESRTIGRGFRAPTHARPFLAFDPAASRSLVIRLVRDPDAVGVWQGPDRWPDLEMRRRVVVK